MKASDCGFKVRDTRVEQSVGLLPLDNLQPNTNGSSLEESFISLMKI